MILLDTNVLIDLQRYRLDPDESYAASILSRAELEFGVTVADSIEDAAVRRRRLNELDDVFDWLLFDLQSSRSYGAIAAAATVTGSRIRGKDALIAAQAHRHGAAVMTSNTTDFEPFAHVVRILRPETRGA